MAHHAPLPWAVDAAVPSRIRMHAFMLAQLPLSSSWRIAVGEGGRGGG